MSQEFVIEHFQRCREKSRSKKMTLGQELIRADKRVDE